MFSKPIAHYNTTKLTSSSNGIKSLYQKHSKLPRVIRSCYSTNQSLQFSRLLKNSNRCMALMDVRLGTSHNRLEIGTILSDHDNEQSTILACSSSKGSNILVTIPKNMIRIVKEMIQNLIKLILIIIRGTEITLKLSPLIILGPIAYATTSNTAFIDGELLPGDKLLNNGMKKYSTYSEYLFWSYLLNALQNLGPAFVKFTQWAGTRRDLFSPYICNHFSTLHSYNNIHTWKHTQDALSKAFGSDYSKKMTVFPNEVLGSGCVAQVYRGELISHDEHTTDLGSNPKKKLVAVKILHPNIAASLDRDLMLMSRVASLIHSMIPLEIIRCLNLPRAAENFVDIMKYQVDLRTEGENLQRFRSNFGCDERDQLRKDATHKSPNMWQDGFLDSFVSGVFSWIAKSVSSEKKDIVSFPRPVEGWIAQDVLVEDLISDDSTQDRNVSGSSKDAYNAQTISSTVSPIADFLSDDSIEGMRSRKALAAPLLRAFLKMVFVDNFIHCDLHPGNVIVKTIFEETNDQSSTHDQNETKKSYENKRFEIYFLDAGIVTSLSQVDKQNLKDLFKSVILNDGKEVGRLMVDRAKHEECSQIDGGLEAFSNGMSGIVSEFHDKRDSGLSLGAIGIGELLGRVLDLCRVYKVEVDPSMANIVISTLVLEGLGRSLDSDLNLIDFAFPFVIGNTVNRFK